MWYEYNNGHFLVHDTIIIEWYLWYIAENYSRYFQGINFLARYNCWFVAMQHISRWQCILEIMTLISLHVHQVGAPLPWGCWTRTASLQVSRNILLVGSDRATPKGRRFMVRGCRVLSRHRPSGLGRRVGQRAPPEGKSLSVETCMMCTSKSQIPSMEWPYGTAL